MGLHLWHCAHLALPAFLRYFFSNEYLRSLELISVLIELYVLASSTMIWSSDPTCSLGIKSVIYIVWSPSAWSEIQSLKKCSPLGAQGSKCKKIFSKYSTQKLRYYIKEISKLKFFHFHSRTLLTMQITMHINLEILHFCFNYHTNTDAQAQVELKVTHHYHQYTINSWRFVPGVYFPMSIFGKTFSTSYCYCFFYYLRHSMKKIA